MSLSAGTRLGPYEIVSPIGAGGMGEVYQARDTRLDRNVAIKIIPSEFSSNAQLKLRFEREARTISSLNHPNICHLYDVGEAVVDPSRRNERGEDTVISYLVMELLQGETLAERISHGSLPLDELLNCAIALTSALDEAHQRGVVHRDIKPGNIMLTKSGPKLLDFGLAKGNAFSSAHGTPAVDEMTQQRPLTDEGTIVGTFPYMAPEQIEGKEVDAQSDIFSLGAVLYEMATGRPAFSGKTRASVIAAVLATEPPPVSQLRPVMPSALDSLIRDCLAKNPANRWRSVHDIGLLLREIQRGEGAHRPPRKSSRFIALSGWIVAALTLAAALAWLQARSPETDRDAVQFQLYPPAETTFRNDVETNSGALSPSGRYLLTEIAGKDGVNRISLHDFESGKVVAITGTEGGQSPFWSPDETKIGFFADGKLKVMPVGGGPIEELATVSKRSAHGSWSTLGTILFTTDLFGSLATVPAMGGPTRPWKPDKKGIGEEGYAWPHFLPDGRHFLAFRWSANETDVVVGSIEATTVVPLMKSESAVVYSDPGLLLFVRDRSLLAQSFDTRKLRLIGEARVVAGDIPSFITGWAPVTVSRSGRLAYGQSEERTRVSIVDRRGRETAEILPAGRYRSFGLSPDGRKLAFEIPDAASKKSELWIRDVTRGVTSRFTINPDYFDSSPLWSPDGTKVVYASHGRTGKTHLRLQTVGQTSAVTIYEGGLPWPHSWSPDGSRILFSRQDEKTLRDIWTVAATGERKAVPLIASPFNEGRGSISPDGVWLAFMSDESGRGEIYVQTLGGAGPRWQLSDQGGDHPRWSHDGSQVYFVAPGGLLMSVRTIERPSDFERAAPENLFTLAIANTDYAPMNDGEHFLVSSKVPGDRGAWWNVVDGWQAVMEASRKKPE